tara:strand:- start:348 stop:788 length:441 start_codon:yes stop_codon:yes gene_type:complete
MSCSKTSNNKYFKCPARMSDARFCTDYRPNSYINGAIKVANNLQNSYQYRLFLQRNANQLFQLNNNLFFARNGCGPCMKPYNQGTVPPVQNEINCNTQSCIINNTNKNGIGLGIDYHSIPSARFKQPIVSNNVCGDMQSSFNQNGL